MKLFEVSEVRNQCSASPVQCLDFECIEIPDYHKYKSASRTVDLKMSSLSQRMRKLQTKLLAIRLGPGAVVLPKEVTRIHMRFAPKINQGHMGPRYGAKAQILDLAAHSDIQEVLAARTRPIKIPQSCSLDDHRSRSRSIRSCDDVRTLRTRECSTDFRKRDGIFSGITTDG